MQTQSNEVDFTGQNFYCGIDIHKKNWVVTIETGDMPLKTFTQDANPELLVKYLHRNYPGGRPLGNRSTTITYQDPKAYP